MASPFIAPTQPASYNANPPSDDGTQSVANTVTWNSTIKAKIGDPVVTWINNLISACSTAFSVTVTGPATATAGNIPTFADNTGKIIQDSGVSVNTGVPSGTMAPYAGPVAPATWLLCFGQAVSRTTNATLFNNITIQTTGNTHSTITIDGMGSTANMMVGMPISGSGIQAGTTIASVVGGTSITLSVATTTSVNGVAIVVAPWGVGDGSTTFNVPDGRGRGPFGFDAMGGSAAGRLGSNTSAGGFTGTNYIGQTAGAQNHTPTVAETAAHSHGASGLTLGGFASLVTGSGIGSSTAIQDSVGGALQKSTTAASPTDLGNVTDTGFSNATVNGSTANVGSSTPFNITPPAFTVNWIIKL